jgi:hypothetical protein
VKQIKNIILIFFTIILTMSFSSKISHQIILDEFYSEFLSLNLIHAMKSANVLYHLSEENSFSKELLETELDRIENNVRFGNADISKMVEHASNENKVKISKYLKNIDEHLAAVYIDIKAIRNDLNRKKNISPSLSDIYYQLKKSEYQDHKEIKRILIFKTYNEPAIVKH